MSGANWRLPAVGGRVFLAAALLAAGAAWLPVEGRAGVPVPAVVRLHVVAHSDQPADQEDKEAVRRAVVSWLSLRYAGAPGPARAGAGEWYAYLQAHRDRLRDAALAALRARGRADRPVRVEFVEADYSALERHGQLWPAGRYRTVRVVIGEGAGHNWWCVAFPFLCPSEPGEGARASAADPALTPEHGRAEEAREGGGRPAPARADPPGAPPAQAPGSAPLPVRPPGALHRLWKLWNWMRWLPI